MVTIIAHRGASAEAPENTLASFQTALHIGVDFVELDVHLSSDGTPVIHDDTTQRITGGLIDRQVASMTVDQLHKLDAGSWFAKEFKGEPIPTLAEVLQLDRGSTGIMVEIKESPHGVVPICKAVLRELEQYKHPNEGPIVVASFVVEQIAYVKEHAPDYPLLGLVEDKIGIERFQTLGVSHLGLDNMMASDSLIKELKDKQHKIWIWTVDDPDRALHLVRVGVDGIISNNPRLLKKYFTKIV
jgi:glycerophosphoryl diester phosphodiesterase